MIIYSVTISVDNDVQEDWLKWMKETHIPDVMNTGLFIDHQICRLISHQEEDQGTTYNIQYHCAQMADLHKYQSQHAARLQKEHNERYDKKVVAFRTLLEKI